MVRNYFTSNEELYPIYDSAKSFYRKAYAVEDMQGITLYSYNTPILKIYDNRIIRYWNGYSATTQRHINEFMKQFINRNGTYNKAWFTSLPLNKWIAL